MDDRNRRRAERIEGFFFGVGTWMILFCTLLAAAVISSETEGTSAAIGVSCVAVLASIALTARWVVREMRKAASKVEDAVRGRHSTDS